MRRSPILFLAALLVAASAAQAQEIQAPETIGPGELLVVNSGAKPGQSIVWDVLEPADLKHELFPAVIRETVDGGAVTTVAIHDAILACSTGLKPGWIRLSCYTIDWAAQRFSKRRVDIQVLAPNPPPGPDPPVPPVPSTFKEQVTVATGLVKASREIAPKLGDNYAEVVRNAESNPAVWDPPSMMNTIKVLHGEDMTTQQLTDWKDFWPALAKAFVELKLQATDLPGHIQAFKDVADVLQAMKAR